MSVHDDLAAVGHALDELQAAVTALGAHYHESLDLRRLREDVTRVGADLDLLRAAAPATPEAPASVPAAGGDYDPAFWADGDDEDIGTHPHPGR
jgi:hypothetical protein